MKVNVDLLLRMRKDRTWSQDELATASGLNLRTIQRIENEGTVSLQSLKALASAFGVNVRDFEYRESEMINDVLGKEVAITTVSIGAMYIVKGELVEIRAPWLKLLYKKKPVYINMNLVVQIAPL